MKHKLTWMILVVLSWHCASLFGQNAASLNDTLKLNDVIVKARPVMREAGFKRTYIDSVIISDNISLTLSDILNSGTSLFVKTYGPGGIATVSLRGGGASHTAVLWNGINLNSPMLGQSDLGIIPGIAADEISVHNGGSSNTTGQGGLGGVIDVSTSADWNTSPGTEFSLMTGSYGRFSSSIIGRYGNGNWKFATRLNYQSSDNDFTYLNRYFTSEPVNEKRVNASTLHKTAIQEIWYKNSNSVTSAKIWFQKSDREIPVPINISPSAHDEIINDRIMRSIISHDRYFPGNIIWSSSAVFQSEKMTYSDKVTGIHSPSSVDRITVKSSAILHQGHKTTFRTSLSNEVSFANTTNYSDDVSRNLSSLSVATDHKISEKIDLSLAGGLSLDDGRPVPPDISAGIEYSSGGEPLITAEANLSASSRVPTMNDLYWVPGGIENLKAERGFCAEAASGLMKKISEAFEIDANISSWYNSIVNMIAWFPGENSIWAPANINNVTSFGSEVSMSLGWKSGKKYLRILSNSSYTKSFDRNTKRQLVYVPLLVTSTEMRAGTGFVNIGFSVNYSGKRFIVADNSQYLNGFSVADIWAGVKPSVAGIPFDITIRYENIMNIAYQTIAYHPMPPRAVTVNLSMRVRKNERE